MLIKLINKVYKRSFKWTNNTFKTQTYLCQKLKK